MDVIVIKPRSKSSLTFLKQLLNKLSDVESIEVVSTKDSKAIESLKSGLEDVKEIIAGKKKGTTLKQILDED